MKKFVKYLLPIVLITTLLVQPFGSAISYGQSADSESVDASSPASLSGERRYAPGEILVKFRAPVKLPEVTAAQAGETLVTGYDEIDDLAAQYGITAASALFADMVSPTDSSSEAAENDSVGRGLDRVYKLQVDQQADLLAAMGALGAADLIEYAEPNYIYQLAVQPNNGPSSGPSSGQGSGQGDLVGVAGQPTAPISSSAVAQLAEDEQATDDPLLYYEWGLHNTGQSGGTADVDIDAVEAWETITGTKKILIAVIDSGVDYEHEDLDDGRVRTDIDKDFVYHDDDAMDDAGHGTHVAGIIGAATNNGTGVAGVMWQAEILPLKVCRKDGSCELEAIAQAIHYAADNGAKVINLSLGGDCGETIVEAINYAYGHGVVIVAAAGNSNGSVSYPAKHPPVIAVGAIDQDGQRAFFSNYGEYIDVVAPGVNIFSTVPGNSYDSFSGTSMASPYVAGVAGLLLAQRPDLTNEQVRTILHQSAKDHGAEGFDNAIGHGLVSAANALKTETPAAESVVAPAIAKCSGCSASAATLDMSHRMDMLQLLWRTQLLMTSSGSAGKGYVHNFFRHSPEVSTILLRDRTLRTQAQQILIELTPALHSVLDTERGSPTGDVIISQELIDEITALKKTLASRANTELRGDLEQTWSQMAPQRFAGMKATAAWELMQKEAQVIFVPVMVR